MSPSGRAQWLTVAAIAAIDAIGLAHTGVGLSLNGLARGGGAIALLAALAAFYTYRRPDDRLADLAHTAAFLLALFAASGVLSYLAVATDLPRADDAFAAADRALGFDWPAWFAWVHTHPHVWLILRLAYASAIPQVIAIATYLALTGQRGRNREFRWALTLSLLVIIPISALLPAAGAWAQYDAMRFADVAQIRDFMAMRAGTLPWLDLSKLEGLINFPSFHTALAIFFVYAVRRRIALLAFAAALNGVMIVAVLTEGGHYLVDAISGTAVAGAVIAVITLLQTAAAQKPPTPELPARLKPTALASKPTLP